MADDPVSRLAILQTLQLNKTRLDNRHTPNKGASIMFYRSPTVRTTAVLLLLTVVSISAVLTLYASHTTWPGIAATLAGLVSNALEKKDTAEAKLSKLYKHLKAAKTRKKTLEDTRDNLILEFEPIKAKMDRLKKKLSEIDGKVADKTAEVERRQKEYDNCNESEKDAKSAALNTARGELASLLTQQSNQRETNSKYAEETYGPKLARVTLPKPMWHGKLPSSPRSTTLLIL